MKDLFCLIFFGEKHAQVGMRDCFFGIILLKPSQNEMKPQSLFNC